MEETGEEVRTSLGKGAVWKISSPSPGVQDLLGEAGAALSELLL